MKLRDARAKLPLKDRLRSGCSALAEHGDFVYPGRLIEPEKGGWWMKTWRYNRYETPGIEPGSDRSARRELR
ncbi:hypothetical protein H0H93_006883, partial [Arthromyces matolae]